MDSAGTGVSMERIRYFPRPGLASLITAIKEAGYRVIGPREEPGQGGLVFREISGVEDLPRGLSDEQAPGHYRLLPNGSERYFGWANTASAIKPYVFAPRERLWRVVRKGGKLHFEASRGHGLKTAILGARACDLAALAIQDAHFLRGAHVDPYYRRRRERLLLVAVNCSHAAETCFCVSTGDGPEVKAGFDILLDEIEDGFLARQGSSRGAMILNQVETSPASLEQLAIACVQSQLCRQQQRRLPPENRLPALMKRLDHPRWDEIAGRCLACGNCTAVCPTCFCHREFDTPTLDGKKSEHWRDADSCFNEDHSYIVGEVVRASTRSRYRQWMTHKLASWVEQYGRTGCTGCGRCITWCPAGIDFVEEANLLLKDDKPEEPGS